jgi:hypothetical protein
MRSVSVETVIAGALGSHAAAQGLALEVQRLHQRYAAEVVARWGLCPFLRDPETAFGCFAVLLDREPVLEEAMRVAQAAKSSVIHLVYPLVSGESRPFERFGQELATALRASSPDAPVHAVFHPRMSGDASSPGRRIGLVRHAPDPFVQLVPAGLQGGGTVLAMPGEPLPSSPPPRSRLGLLSASEMEEVVATLDDLKADRERAYAPWLEALASAL